mmetsp:Transcript_27032/g.55718  ORF Transcript_27032/g.55718 Transcript_27032/m.55718 type:complete len:135 (+) Transcript_27032:970-1374(+)
MMEASTTSQVSTSKTTTRREMGQNHSTLLSVVVLVSSSRMPLMSSWERRWWIQFTPCTGVPNLGIPSRLLRKRRSTDSLLVLGKEIEGDMIVTYNCCRSFPSRKGHVSRAYQRHQEQVALAGPRQTAATWHLLF